MENCSLSPELCWLWVGMVAWRALYESCKWVNEVNEWMHITWSFQLGFLCVDLSPSSNFGILRVQSFRWFCRQRQYSCQVQVLWQFIVCHSWRSWSTGFPQAGRRLPLHDALCPLQRSACTVLWWHQSAGLIYTKTVSACFIWQWQLHNVTVPACIIRVPAWIIWQCQMHNMTVSAYIVWVSACIIWQCQRAYCIIWVPATQRE